MAGRTLEEILKERTREGELYEKLPNDWLRCYACGHLCRIPPGAVGVCKVRFNEGGVLRVPSGYVGGAAIDPIEKKPFFHALPGSPTLSFGMLGCDYHCSYCFPAETNVVTDRGVTPIGQIFARAHEGMRTVDAEVRFTRERRALTHTGEMKPILKAFQHHYNGDLSVIMPRYLPALRCTPGHRILATRDPSLDPVPVSARDLTTGHLLAIPKPAVMPHNPEIDLLELFEGVRYSYRVPRSLAQEQVEEILSATAGGATSRALGAQYGKDPSYIRHVRSRVRRGTWVYERIRGAVELNGRVRFFKAKGEGLPRSILLDARLASLLGYYCAEGRVTSAKHRPNGRRLTFSFGPGESTEREAVRGLLADIFQVRSREVVRETSVAVESVDSAAATFFGLLCGRRATEKRVPQRLFSAPPPCIEAFLDAYVRGDGHIYPNGKISATTVSSELAWGIAFMVLRCGWLPSVYETKRPSAGRILGRSVKLAARQYTVVWYRNREIPRRYHESQGHFLIPIRSITSEPFDGDVYNLEVEDHHSYTAGLLAVKNCQNWITSQALRDPSAISLPESVTAEAFVDLAVKHRVPVITSTYNEPLITSEWAVEILRLAKERGIRGAYVSNGNATPQVLDYLRPWVDLYKVDLKGFDDRNYRKLGGVLDTVLRTIRLLKERDFWVEVVTLVVPGFNDSDDELRRIAGFLVSVSPDIPWHVTAFHQDYKRLDSDRTPAATLLRAASIGEEAGLHFVYTGNLPGVVGEHENTRCPSCRETVIRRLGMRVLENRIDNGSCPKCRARIPGVWP